MIIIAVVVLSATCYIDVILSTMSWSGIITLIGTLTLFDNLNQDYSRISCHCKTRLYLAC